MTRRELIAYCLAFPAAYEDYPFDSVADSGAWTVMRHGGNKKSFALIYERGGNLCVNLKCEPFEADLLRQAFDAVVPAYHMNKRHWNTVTVGGDVPTAELKRQIEASYRLVRPKLRKSTDPVQLGPYDWRVLALRGDCALLLSDIAIEKRMYHSRHTDTTWEACDLRQYLNGPFYHAFAEPDRARIIRTRIANHANPWFGTDGGSDTTDHIFLLSIEEVVAYFGDSGQLQNKNPGSKLFINDLFKSARRAKDANGGAAWWWLRSPGIRGSTAAQVYNGGAIHISGHFVDNGLGGVRPALWVKC